MDNKVRLSVNEAMNEQFQYMLTKATSKSVIILQAPTDSDSCAALRFDNEIRNGINTIGIMTTKIKANCKMTRFIVNEIPPTSPKTYEQAA